MHCINCGKSISETSKFCPFCRANVALSTVVEDIETRITDEAVVKRNPLGKKTIMTIIIIIVAAALVIVFLTLNKDIFSRSAEPEEISNVQEYIEEDEEDGNEDAQSTKGLHVENIGDIVEFGVWRGEPIEWRVLDIQEGKALLISKDILTVRQYDGLEEEYGERLSDVNIDWGSVKVTWADSEIRAWLNKDFIDKSFAYTEQDIILTSSISNPDNPDFGTYGGKDTEDMVFMLSIDEAKMFFVDNSDRIAEINLAVEDVGYIKQVAYEDWADDQEMLDYAETIIDNNLEQNQSWWWWLRSPGIGSDTAACVFDSGEIITSGVADYYGNRGVTFFTFGVRPAMWVKTGGTESGNNVGSGPSPATSNENPDRVIPGLSGSNPIIEIRMEDGGAINIRLDREAAPITVDNFLMLVGEGFYDGLTFHRVIDGFMIQGGDPIGDGTGGSANAIYGEFSENGWNNPISHKRGVISMARAKDPNSATSQFFITNADSTFLDGEYAAFGQVISGMEVVDKISLTETNTVDKPLSPVIIKSIRLVN